MRKLHPISSKCFSLVNDFYFLPICCQFKVVGNKVLYNLRFYILSTSKSNITAQEGWFFSKTVCNADTLCIETLDTIPFFTSHLKLSFGNQNHTFGYCFQYRCHYDLMATNLLLHRKCQTLGILTLFSSAVTLD